MIRRNAPYAAKVGLKDVMRFRQLTSLSLCGCTDVDETLLRFIARLPSLRRLDLSNCASVDDRLLLSLVSLGKLESLNLAGCVGLFALCLYGHS